MVWPFSFDWFVLCASELVRSVVRTPCCRLLVHKACLYSALAISPSRPVLRPRALTANKSWILDAFDACVGVCRVSGVHGLNVPSPLCPPHAHSYHGFYLQSMDPPLPPPSSAGPPDDDDRVSETHRLNSAAPLTPLTHSSFVRST